MNKVLTNKKYLLKDEASYIFTEKSMGKWWSAEPGTIYENSEEEREAFKVKGKHFSLQDTLWLSGLDGSNEEVFVGAKTRQFALKYTRDIVLSAKQGETKKQRIAVVQGADGFDFRGNFKVFIGTNPKGTPEFTVRGGNLQNDKMSITHAATKTVCCKVEKVEVTVADEADDSYAFSITMSAGMDSAFFMMVAVSCLHISKSINDGISNIAEDVVENVIMAALS